MHFLVVYLSFSHGFYLENTTIWCNCITDCDNMKDLRRQGGGSLAGELANAL